jgi:hypothetical protein
VREIFALALIWALMMSAFADLEDVDRATFLVLVLDEEGEPKGIGTGFFVTEQGHVVTNEHVVSEGDNYVLIGRDFDRKNPPFARLVWSDEKLDLALLKTINAMTPSPPVLPLLSSVVSKASDVYAYGYPSSQLENMRAFRSSDGASYDSTTTKGIVSRIFKSDRHGEIVQHTAEIRVGNSGGPLVNSCGMVVGVNTFLRIVSESAGEKDNFAVSATELIKVIGQRVPGLKILDSCQELSGIPAAAGDVESIPPLRDDQASSTSNFFIAIGLLLYIAGLIFWSRRNSQNLVVQSGASSAQHSPQVVTPSPKGNRALLRLSGFDRQGIPLSLEIVQSSILASRGYIIGRSAAFSDLAIRHEKISRAHVNITYEGGRTLVTDLNSTNGSFLNDVKLVPFKPTTINPSDELRLADIVLSVSR